MRIYRITCPVLRHGSPHSFDSDDDIEYEYLTDKLDLNLINIKLRLKYHGTLQCRSSDIKRINMVGGSVIYHAPSIYFDKFVYIIDSDYDSNSKSSNDYVDRVGNRNDIELYESLRIRLRDVKINEVLK